MKRKPGQKASVFAEKGMRLVRSWETLMVLSESSRPLSSGEINDRVHREYPFSLERCSVQTTTEDLKTLQKCGFPVCRVDRSNNEIVIEEGESAQGKFKNTKWRLGDLSAIGTFSSPYLNQPSAADIVSLSLCRALLKDEISGCYSFRSLVSKMLEALQLRLNRRLRQGESIGVDLHDKIMHLGRQYVGGTGSSDVWKKLTHSIAGSRILVGYYQNRNGKKRKIDIAPLAIWFSEGRVYVLAAGVSDRKMRVWRIDRFSDLKIDSRRKAPEISEELIDEALRNSFKGYVADPVEICLTASPEIAYLFREFQYHPSQKIVEREDGSVDVTLACAIGWGVEEWILGFGEFVIVHKPDALKERIKNRVAALFAKYQ